MSHLLALGGPDFVEDLRRRFGPAVEVASRLDVDGVLESLARASRFDAILIDGAGSEATSTRDGLVADQTGDLPVSIIGGEEGWPADALGSESLDAMLSGFSAQDFLAMGVAIAEAESAMEHGDVPVGAALVVAGQVVARGHNRREVDADPTAHAEVLVLREAAALRGRWRLEDATLYVTLEPCAMCAGATVNARLRRLVFGAFDPKAGFCGSLADLPSDPRLNHRLSVEAGLRGEEGSRLLKDFFAARRGRSRPRLP